MKKKLRAVLLLLILIILGILSVITRTPTTKVSMGFYGWTNSTGKHEALFGISNHPPLSVGLHSVSRIDLNAPGSNGTPFGTWTWSRWEPWGITFAVGVIKTNSPMRVVFEFQERAAGARRIPESIREVWSKIIGNEQRFFTGRKFMVTNEIPPAKMSD